MSQVTASYDAAQMRDLKKALDALPEKMRRSILLGASRAGSRALANAAKERLNGHTDSGDLVRSIRVSKPRKQLPGQALTHVKAGDERAWYASMVEYGTEPHSLAPGADRDQNKKQTVPLRHPGAAPVPFMRHALDTASEAAIAASGDYIRKRFATLGRKLGYQP